MFEYKRFSEMNEHEKHVEIFMIIIGSIMTSPSLLLIVLVLMNLGVV
ncbi:hypothetical protein LFAB_14445 [Lactiplantibacillus fabifermentans T30PCM01]|uniref:Uncharacterized protein n=1 Tax=Lactiplantibacillus fabifermentans T30PCM01 TaxID=1400520 RepID=W6T518_9LACO|nr:hypothetical protein LFAB_14445 [Lactiplantibacillus fabifermentans T30PCM01]